MGALLVLLSPSTPVGARVASGARQPYAAQPSAPGSTTTIRIGVLRNGSYEIVTLPLEVYVARVLTGEAAPQSPPASLEALAIAIRTVHDYEPRTPRRGGVRPLRSDALPGNAQLDADNRTRRTRHRRADPAFRGAPATVFYSASCGGRSEKPSNVWPGAEDPPYLSIHDDDGCGEGVPAWSAELAGADLQRAFVAGGYKGTLRDLKVLSRNDSGRVARLSVEGMTPREITGQDLRMVVGRTLGFQHIQSTTFDLRRTGRAFRFTGRGAGHGVGLCVIGSMKLAAAGQSASTILARYFPGTQIGLRSAPDIGASRDADDCGSAPSRHTLDPVPPVPAARDAPASGGWACLRRAAGRRDLTIGSAGPSAPADSAAVPSDIVIAVPAFASGERDGLGALSGRERQTLAQVLGVTVPRVRVRAHETNEGDERATGQPWFTLGAVASDEIQLAPLDLLRSRGMLDRTLRRQLVHLMVGSVLPARPAWVREGAAVYFADPRRPAAPARHARRTSSCSARRRLARWATPSRAPAPVSNGRSPPAATGAKRGAVAYQQMPR